MINANVVFSKLIGCSTITVWSNYTFRWDCWHHNTPNANFKVKNRHVEWMLSIHHNNEWHDIDISDEAYEPLIEAHYLINFDKQVEEELS